MERVDFYVLAGTDERERWKFACRVIDKAFAAEQRVLVWLENADAVAGFDDVLWTFAQDSFVPHEPLGAESDWEEAPVLLTCPGAPNTGLIEQAPADVVVNLAASMPSPRKAARQVIEIIDAEPSRRDAGRARFRQYRAEGVEPTTHNVA
jgi:DNA polymerase-3 subunit chi